MRLASPAAAGGAVPLMEQALVEVLCRGQLADLTDTFWRAPPASTVAAASGMRGSQDLGYGEGGRLLGEIGERTNCSTLSGMTHRGSLDASTL